WCNWRCSAPVSPSACRPPPRPTPCDTASPPTCWHAEPTCAPSRNCSATPASPPPRCTPKWTPPEFSTSTGMRTPEREGLPGLFVNYFLFAGGIHPSCTSHSFIGTRLSSTPAPAGVACWNGKQQCHSAHSFIGPGFRHLSGNRFKLLELL